MTENEFIQDEEQELIPVSALNQYIYCPRRCALIHIEQLWAENLFTVEGKIMHEKVDTANRESRGNVRIEFGTPLRSLKLGLIGRADVVEFHKQGNKWIPFPVEYKRGKPKLDSSDKVQLCAQAMCFEEMMGAEIPEGALFYGLTRHRYDVKFDVALRKETEETAKRLHELIESGITPKAEYSARCEKCSLVEQCLPRVSRKASSYLAKIVEEE